MLVHWALWWITASTPQRAGHGEIDFFEICDASATELNHIFSSINVGSVDAEIYCQLIYPPALNEQQVGLAIISLCMTRKQCGDPERE